jgi:hypothetical protein
MRTAEDRSANVQALSSSIPLKDLRVVLAVHRKNCRQIGCPILAALEERVGALGAPGAPGATY